MGDILVTFNVHNHHFEVHKQSWNNQTHKSYLKNLTHSSQKSVKQMRIKYIEEPNKWHISRLNLIDK